jgi:ATP-dependent RNA helicase DeaD
MTKFEDLKISAEVMRAITELGYEAATPIQAETLPLLLGNDTDYLGLAATGTGKTAAFGIPLLERTDREIRGVQALILCPTRELAIQVAGQIDLLGKYLGIKALPIYGGTGYGDQIYGLKNGATVVVGTPGRVVDHIEKGTLSLKNLKTLVLDEADEMISMGFQEDLEAVLRAAPEGQANIWLFSATMGREVQHVADNYLKNPQRVQINKTEVLSSTVEQIYFKTHEYDKPELLCRLIDGAEDFYGIVFCQTKALVADVTTFLSGKGYKADCLHGDLDQTARDRVMKAFRDRKISILIATDVACRGLDVKDVSHVVNYSIPRELDNYVHRIGRTARSGKAGIAFSLVTFSHRELIGKIERLTKSTMKEGTPPSLKDIALKRINKVRTAFEATAQGRATSMVPAEWKEALAAMTPDDIAGRFLAMLMPDLFDKKQEERLTDTRTVSPSVRAEKTGERPRRDSRVSRPSSESRPMRDDRGPSEERAPREDRPQRSFSGPKKDFRPPFKKAFGAAPRGNEERSTPPWERDGAGPSAAAGKQFKPRWKNKFGAGGSPSKSYAGASRSFGAGPRASGEGSFSRVPREAGSFSGGAAKPKKKAFGHWKSKKETPTT